MRAKIIICERSNKSKLPSHVRLSIVALTVFLLLKCLGLVKGHSVTVVDLAVV